MKAGQRKVVKRNLAPALTMTRGKSTSCSWPLLVELAGLPSCSCERSFLHTTRRGTKSKIMLLLVAGWQNEFKFSSVFNRAK
jgi:hypothetical protein